MDPVTLGEARHARLIGSFAVDPLHNTLRPGQAQALEYTSGCLGISAVPGSGKTFTLEILITDLIARRGVRPDRIGVFTYMRSSRANLIHRINQRLRQQGSGVRFSNAFTLHSLSLRVLRTFEAQASDADQVQILEAYEQDRLLTRLVRSWLRYNRAEWEKLLPQEEHPMRLRNQRARFSQSFQSMCAAVIQTAKNYRLSPTQIDAAAGGFLHWAVQIYQTYQFELNRKGVLDYNDLGWQAVELLTRDGEIRQQVQGWYDYLFEDEAQDSSPLQDELLQVMALGSGACGNLVRVGDPNQSIMGTFTTAEPRLFRQFCQHSPSIILDEASRSAPRILTLANALVHWVNRHHPLEELRASLIPQSIQPASSGPANPPDTEALIEFHQVLGSPEDELADVVDQAVQSIRTYPQQTVVILVPTNDQGVRALDLLREKHFRESVDLLRGNPSQTRVIRPLHQIALYLAQPTSTPRLITVVETLADWAGLPTGEPLEQIKVALQEIPPEKLLFPAWDHPDPLLGSEVDPAYGEETRRLLRQIAVWVKASRSPWGDVLNLIAQTLYPLPEDLFVCHYVIDQLDRILGDRPGADWQEVTDEIQAIQEGKLNNLPAEIFSFAAAPGSITVCTLHRSKGLEWDQVFLTGLSAYEFPVVPRDHAMGLSFLEDTDMRAEAIAELKGSVGGSRGGGSATERAFLELAGEKLRLLYVGITRAKRRLICTVSSQDRFDRDQRPSQLFSLLKQVAHGDPDQLQDLPQERST